MRTLLAILALACTLGLFGYQTWFLDHTSIQSAPDEPESCPLTIAEANAIAGRALEMPPPITPSIEAQPGRGHVFSERRGGFVPQPPRRPVKLATTPTKPVGASAAPHPRPAPRPIPARSRTSASSRSSSPISQALDKKFHTRPDFGFSTKTTTPQRRR